MKSRSTEKQGQYLAFIYYYTKLHGRAPAELDMQRYFRVTPPSVHQMVLTLASNGLIENSRASAIHPAADPARGPARFGIGVAAYLSDEKSAAAFALTP